MTGTIVVFGGAGQVGTALGQVPVPQGWRVRRVGRGEADITRRDQVDACIGPDASAVVNAAAYTAVDRAEAERDLAFAINAEGAGIVAGACARRGVPLLHISTDFVFDGRKPTAYAEDDPVAPLGVYGESKESGERAVRAATDRHIILRTSWVYAPHGQNFVRTMLRVGRERGRVRVVGDQSGSPTAATEIAAAITQILHAAQERGATGWGTFHYCGAGVTTWFDFAAAIFEEAGRHGNPMPELTRITTAEYPTAARRPTNSALDCSKLLGAYGVRPRPWRDSLRDCVARIFRDAEPPS